MLIVYQLFVIIACLLVGCQRLGTQQQLATESEEAQQTLTMALGAWKAGEVKSLLRREPPIRFVDDDLVSGMKLTDFNVNPGKRLAADVYVLIAELVLQDRSGRVFERKATYQVGLSPDLTVLRSDG